MQIRTPDALAKWKYDKHKAQSKFRGIDFLMTYDEWYNWWLSNGVDKKLDIKWTGKNRPCMCRFGDTGPYALGNVFFGLNPDNAKDRHKNYVGVDLTFKSREKKNYKWGDEIISCNDLINVHKIPYEKRYYYRATTYDKFNKEVSARLTRRWNKLSNRARKQITLEEYIKQNSRYPNPYFPKEN
jgi:hypothetical protein